MKFTEGYWLRSERVDASYGAQAFEVLRIKNGMRVIAPTRPVKSRGDALDQTVLTLEFTSFNKNDIRVCIKHFEAYDAKKPEYELNEAPEETEVEIDDEKAVMSVGTDGLKVVVDRNTCDFHFEANGRLLTGSGFRNFGYMRWDKHPKTMFMQDNYMVDDYKPYMLQELSIKPGEYIYGFGEQFTAFTKNGQTIDIWNEDGGTASQAAYKNIPFYLTNEGYGVFVEETGTVSFEVSSEKVEYVGFSVEGESLSYHLIYGPTIKEVVSNYTNITGRPALPPSWTFGLWLSTSFTTNYDEATTSSFIDGMKERDIPLSVFHFDCYWMKAFHWCDFNWDDETFPNVEDMLKRYHSDKGVKICAWVNPYIAQGTDTFKEGVENGYFLMRADGKGVKQIDNWQPGMAIVDFTNPDAVKWYKGKIRRLLEQGVDSVKTDFGERIPIDVKYNNGADPKSMHNYYTYLYNKAVFETVEEVKGKNNAALFARSATVGGQKFPIHWGGDSSASYASMAESLRAGLSLALCGFGFWSHDISGFEATAAPDLYKRWVQFGLLSSHSRLHGSSSYRVPWLFDKEADEVVKYFTKLKCTLMPYIYLKAVESHESGIPVLRPMIMEFPDDPACRCLDMQYMLGDRLLVAPVFNAEGTAEFYVPDGGVWTDYISGKKYEGGRWYKEKYDYMSLPLLVRPDTILPIGGRDNRPDYDYMEGLTLKCYELKEKEETEVYIPEPDSVNKNKIIVSKNGDSINVYPDHIPALIQ